MPLSCQSPEGWEFAFRHSDETWSALRERNALERHLRMPCCGSAVVLKRSKLGTLFFAHTRRGPCTSGPETPEHLLLKDITARAATSAGWEARTEVTGKSPAGAEWKADVLCTRLESERPIAFEIQWTPQELAVTEFRQRRYTDSGVSAIWLMRQRDAPISRDVPAFVVDLPAGDRPIVLIRSETLLGVYSRHTRDQDERRISQRIPLESFITGTLNGGLKFAPAVGTSVPANAMAARVSCWKCGGETQVVLAVELQTERMFPGFGNVRIEINSLGAHGELGLQWVERYLPAELLRQWGAGEIKVRASKAAGESYLSNGCVHCDSLYGRYFSPDLYYDVAPLFEIHVAVEPWLAGPPEQPSPLKRWWFDPGASTTSALSTSVHASITPLNTPSD